MAAIFERRRKGAKPPSPDVRKVRNARGVTPGRIEVGIPEIVKNALGIQAGDYVRWCVVGGLVTIHKTAKP